MAQKNVAVRILERQLLAQQAIKLAYGGAAGYNAATIAPPSGAAQIAPKPATLKPATASKSWGFSPAAFTTAGPGPGGSSGIPTPPSSGPTKLPAAPGTAANMLANSGRVGSGILGSVAGGLGTVGTGVAAGATNAWNAVTPQSMNTSPGWTEGVNNVFEKTRAFTENSARDVYGGLGGDANYQTNLGKQTLEQVRNDPNVDPTTRMISRGAELTGDLAFAGAQVAGGVGAINGLRGVGAAANTARAAAPAASVASTAATTAPAAANASRAATLAGTLYSGAKAYGNATGLLPTSSRGLAMTYLNPVLQQGAQLVDNKYDTNFSGRHTDRMDASTLAGRALFPVAPAYAAVGDAVTGALSTQVNEAGETVGDKIVGGAGAAVDAALPGGRPALDPTFAVSDADRQTNTDSPLPAGSEQTDTAAANVDQTTNTELDGLLAQHGDDINNWPPEAVARAQELTAGQEAQQTDSAGQSAPVDNNANNIPAGQPGFSAQHLPDPDNTPPEVAQQLDEYAAQMANDPEAQAGLSEAMTNPEVAQEKAEAAKPAFEQQVTEEYSQANPQPENPQDWGTWANGLMEHVSQAWTNMGPMGQLAFGIGMPLGLIGILGGGLPGFLLAAAGLGAAGATGALGGMFGTDAQVGAAELAGGVSALMGGGGEQPEMTPAAPQIQATPAQDANPAQPAGTPEQSAAPAQSTTPAKPTTPATQPPAAPDQATKQMATDLATATDKNLIPALIKHQAGLTALFQKPDSEISAIFQQLDSGTRANLKKNVELAAQKFPSYAPKLKRITTLLEKNAAINVMRKAARCWSGYEPVPGKKPYSEDSCRPIGSKKKKKKKTEKKAATPAWQRSAGKNPEGGLNEKGRKSYERETGGNLKAPVTESNPSGESAKRQNSFCSRMCGMKRVNTGSKTKADPDSRINKSLRKWNCKCSSAMEFGNKIAQLEKQAANPACPGGVCRRPQAAPQKAAPPQYSKTPFDRAYAEAAFKQHNIPFNAASTDQQLYNLYMRKGAIKPGQQMNPFQAMVGERHGYLPPAPIQPTLPQAKPATTQTSAPPRPMTPPTPTDIDPPATPKQPKPPAPVPATVVGNGQPGLPKPTLPR